MKYTITSVDWNPEQTRLWLHHVKKNCPDAEVVLVKDTKPLPWCWSAGKLECFRQNFQTDHVIYMDTDTIVTEDLEFMFEKMGQSSIGSSSSIPLVPYHKRSNVRKALAPLGMYPPHFSSGMLSMKGVNLPVFADAWQDFMVELHEMIGRDHYMDEISLSYLMHGMDLWDMPLEVHGNLCGRKYFGNSECPSVIHYHKPERLVRFGLRNYLRSK